MSRKNRSRKQRQRSAVQGPAPPPEVIPSDRLARWRGRLSFESRRNPVLQLDPSGIVVEASTPETLAAATDTEIVRRTSGKPEN